MKIEVDIYSQHSANSVYTVHMNKKYVHGYSPRETQRLREQSLIIEKLLHRDTQYPPGSRVLEAGCGVGAQTVILARKSPQAEIISTDISEGSLREAQTMIKFSTSFICISFMTNST